MKKDKLSSLRLGAALLVLVSFLSSCSKEMSSPASDPVTNPGISVIPKVPGTIIVPADNPMSDAKVELGRHLFYDKSLSADQKTSCGSCHQANIGFSDQFPVSIGFQQQHGTRNAPPLANVGYNTSFTWDGRFTSLEAHVPGPIFNSVEMGNNLTNDPRQNDTSTNGYNSKPGNNDTLFLFKRLNGHTADIAGKNYPQLFLAAWGSTDIGLDKIAKSIACFERTFISTQSTFDKYNNGDEVAYKDNPQALHGFQLFTDANGANCVSCHSGYNFTDQQFHDNGIGIGQSGDKGRFDIEKIDANIGKFKTPSLRNIALSGPYMHDGRFATLQQVLNHYNEGGRSTKNQDSKVRSLNLSNADMSDIIAFLQTLSDYNFVTDKANKFSNPWSN